MNPSRSGRDGLLRLAFEQRAQPHATGRVKDHVKDHGSDHVSDHINDHVTVLRHCRYTLPLQILSPLALDDGTSYLLLLNPTGGVLGGDRLRTEISFGENSAACLSTPSATRVYRTSGPAAEIHTALQVARNATVEYLPDQVILHAGSALRQSLRIEMQPGSRGIFLDSFAAGRVTQNELWRFREFDSRTEITLAGKLLYASRAKLTPAYPPATSDSQLAISHSLPAVPLCHPPCTSHSPLPEKNLPPFRGSKLQLRHYSSGAAGALAPEEPDLPWFAIHPSPNALHSPPPYSASLLIVADQLPDWRPVVTSLRAELDAVPEVIGGVSALSGSGCSARYMANSAIALHEATSRLWTAARREVFNLPPRDLRKY